MVRDYQINGETMVYVKGGDHLSLLPNSPMTSRTELGLSVDQIKITPTYYKKDVQIDNFGPEVPLDIMSYMSDCYIEMSLVHFDSSILNICLAESNGGIIQQNTAVDLGTLTAGKAGKAGALMGKGLQYFASGNNFISLSLISTPWIQNGNFPYGNVLRFPTCYITDKISYPVGTKHTVVELTWRAIPYLPSNLVYSGYGYWTYDDYSSVNAIVFDNQLDT